MRCVQSKNARRADAIVEHWLSMDQLSFMQARRDPDLTRRSRTRTINTEYRIESTTLAIVS
jgi:hypothetical protein